jgi:hypothetical protein
MPQCELNPLVSTGPNFRVVVVVVVTFRARCFPLSTSTLITKASNNGAHSEENCIIKHVFGLKKEKK